MKKVIKAGIKTILPHKIVIYIKNIRFFRTIKRGFLYDYERYINYADTYESNTSTKLMGRIIR